VEDLEARLKIAVETRDQLARDAQRIEGRKEAAEKALQEVEDEIKERGLDPATLDKTVADLRTAYVGEVEKLERDVKAARESLAPYMENPA